jgi:hypothetical protein
MLTSAPTTLGGYAVRLARWRLRRPLAGDVGLRSEMGRVRAIASTDDGLTIGVAAAGT